MKPLPFLSLSPNRSRPDKRPKASGLGVKEKSYSMTMSHAPHAFLIDFHLTYLPLFSNILSYGNGNPLGPPFKKGEERFKPLSKGKLDLDLYQKNISPFLNGPYCSPFGKGGEGDLRNVYDHENHPYKNTLFDNTVPDGIVSPPPLLPAAQRGCRAGDHFPGEYLWGSIKGLSAPGIHQHVCFSPFRWGHRGYR